jgi:ankyrin repeat protein
VLAGCELHFHVCVGNVPILSSLNRLKPAFALLALCAGLARAASMDQELIAAAENGNVARIAELLKRGANVNAQDERGRTPAMAATYARQTKAVQALLQAGADVNRRDQMLNNPFLYAGAEGMLEILKLAHAAGADPRITNRFGGTALIPAAERGHVEAVSWLLANTKVEVNHINRLGWTALLEAIVLSDGGPRHQEIVATLIRHGADVNLADREGRTALDHARQRGYARIRQLLQAAGAK